MTINEPPRPSYMPSKEELFDYGAAIINDWQIGCHDIIYEIGLMKFYLDLYKFYGKNHYEENKHHEARSTMDAFVEGFTAEERDYLHEKYIAYYIGKSSECETERELRYRLMLLQLYSALCRKFPQPLGTAQDMMISAMQAADELVKNGYK